MKRIFFIITLSLGIFTANAQSKFGYIATDELLGQMPEAEKADATLKEYQASLAEQGQDMMDDLKKKDSLFVMDSIRLSPSMKEIKKKELVEFYQKVQGWEQQAQDLYQQKAQELIAPLRAKALDAIKAVAKENNFTYIFDMNSLIVAPPGDDVLELVKKKLGIKESAKPVMPVKKN